MGSCATSSLALVGYGRYWQRRCSRCGGAKSSASFRSPCSLRHSCRSCRKRPRHPFASPPWRSCFIRLAPTSFGWRAKAAKMTIASVSNRGVPSASHAAVCARTKPSETARIETKMLSEHELRFLAERRVAHLATADRDPGPHVVPVCFVVSATTLYVTIDEKPKRRPARLLKRLRNIADNPQVAVVVDRYEEDWARLGWVMLTGHAEILPQGLEHDEAQALLRSRYPQLEAMRIADQPVIAVRIARVTSWGNL